MSCECLADGGGKVRVILACGLLLGLLTSGCGFWSKPARQESATTRTVGLLQPELRSIQRIVEQPSFVESYERTAIYPKMTAYIEKWNVDIGDRVKEGEVLAKLFVPELVEEWGTKKATVKLDQERIALAKQLVKVAEADVQAAEASLVEAKAILGRYQAQVDRWASEVDRLGRETAKGVVDPQVLLESKNQWKSSAASRDAANATISKATAELISKQATLQQDKIAVDVAVADLSVAQSEAKRLEALVGYLILPAPFDGIVTARNANTLDFVLPATGDPTAMPNSPFLSPDRGAAPIYVVERTDVVRVFVDVPEYEANFVRPGTKATVLIEAFDDEPISAAVTRIAWALNVKSRTLRAEIDLPNTGGEILPLNVPNFVLESLHRVKLPKTSAQILPGMYAYGNIFIERHGVRALPLSMLDTSDGKTFYWSCQNHQAVRMEVKTGISDDEWIEITKCRSATGLDKAWQSVEHLPPAIVADDVSTLVDGEAVRISGNSD